MPILRKAMLNLENFIGLNLAVIDEFTKKNVADVAMMTKRYWMTAKWIWKNTRYCGWVKNR